MYFFLDCAVSYHFSSPHSTAAPKMPASLAKKNATATKVAAEALAAQATAKKSKITKRREVFKRAEKYVPPLCFCFPF